MTVTEILIGSFLITVLPSTPKQWRKFAKSRNITLQHIPPLHPSANPVETFMKPLGKAMKITHHNKGPEKEALQQLLAFAMLFLNPANSSFPRMDTKDVDLNAARDRDIRFKLEREAKVNASKYKVPQKFEKGDKVLIRNFNKTSKYDPSLFSTRALCSERGITLQNIVRTQWDGILEAPWWY